MEIGKAFTFVPSEDDWIKKLGIGAIIVLFTGIIPIIPTIFLVGYGIRVGKNVARGEEHPLPDWDEWGELFMDGAVVSVATFVYALPIVLLGLCMVILSLPALTESWDSSEIGFSALSGAATAGIFAMCCIFFLYLLILIAVVPALYAQYIRTGEFGPLFRVGEVLGIARDNIGDIILVSVAAIVAALLLGLISSVLSITICGGFIATLVGTVWINVAMGHMYGQIAAKIEGKADYAA